MVAATHSLVVLLVAVLGVAGPRAPGIDHDEDDIVEVAAMANDDDDDDDDDDHDGRVAHLERLLREVRVEAFPEIDDAHLTTTVFSSDTVFLMSNFDVPAALGGPPLELVILLNPRLFDLDGGPGDVALRAILAHELAHSLDYLQRAPRSGVDGLVGLLPALLLPDAEAVMERRTDLVAVQRGYAAGLIAYRSWLYRVLDDDGVDEKRRVYYSPLELSMLGRLQRRCSKVLNAAMAAPPQNARAIARLAPARCFE